MTTPHDADLINADRQRQAEMLQEKLGELGVMTRIAHYTGDSSYPTEYTLMYQDLSITGPTMDLALLYFVEKVLCLLPNEPEPGMIRCPWCHGYHYIDEVQFCPKRPKQPPR